jgi:hypothetical protein
VIDTQTAPNSGLLANQPVGSVPAVNIALAPPFIMTPTSTPQTYTIEAVQQLPSAAYGSNRVVLNSVTFSITAGISVNGTVGTVK